MKRIALCIAALIAVAPGFAATAHAGAATHAAATVNTPTRPPYVTIMFGRALYSDATSCDPVTIPADSKTIFDVAAAMAKRRLVGTANVVVNSANTAKCQRRQVFASWGQLAQLATDGWQAISATQDYPMGFGTLTASQVQAETCATLPEFAQHGDSRAWGLLAYPAGQHHYDNGGGPLSGNAQVDIVSHCFAFGRNYGTGINDRDTVLQASGIVSAHTVKGGALGTYESPASLITDMQSGYGNDKWFIIQFYRFRSGFLAGDHNCLGPVSTHYVAYNEDYCWEDFLTFLSGIPTSAIVTDPATVACAWGRIPDKVKVSCR